MSALEKKLLATLLELEAAVKSLPTANPKPDLLAYFTRLDQLTAELPRHTDPRLHHYLFKKSYEKARLFLQGEDAKNKIGNCGHL